MRRKYLLIIVLIVLFQVIAPIFLRVEANDTNTGKPEVCSGPSEMMSNYFNFQKEAITILLGSKVNERLLNVKFDSKGLFSMGVLDFSAIDLIANGIIGNIGSSISNLLTSSVLLILVSSSIVQSSLEGLAILFEDRPIVRDYKEMLDIESQLFDVAYFRSKQINLIRPLDGDLPENLNGLIKKYQEIGLLEVGNSFVGGNSSMADVLSDLISINASMRHFITAGAGLSGYYCFGSLDKNRCNENTFVLKFSQSAIKQLSDDYKDVMGLFACSPYANYFVSSIGSAVSNGKNSVKTSIQDVKNSMNNLWGALVGGGRWNFKNNRGNMCEGISEYEMAQLRAYWGPNRTCGGWFDASLDIGDLSPIFSDVQEYSREKKAKKELEEELVKSTSSENSSISKLLSMTSTSERRKQWYNMFGSGSVYNPQFSSELNSGFENIFKEVMDQYGQSLNNASSSDISDLLPKGEGLLGLVEETIGKTNELKNDLQKIVDKQCSG